MPNHLTKRDLQGRGHLLSTFNKSPDESSAPTTESNIKPEQPATHDEPQSDSDDVLSTMSSNAIEELDIKSESASKGEESAPATDVELPSIENDFDFDDEDFMDIQPMSHLKGKLEEPGTDDEPVSSSEGESDDDARVKTKKTLQEKLDEQKLGEEVQGGTRRTYDDMKGDDESQDERITSWTQEEKRSRKNKKNTSYSKPKSYPSSSTRSAAATPDKRSQQSKLDSKKKKEATPGKQTFPAFKVPMQIDIVSPQKPRAGDAKGPDDPAPQASNSNSSMETSFSNDPQFMSFEDNAADSPLSSAPSSHGPLKSLCPMCKQEVDPELLMLFEAQPKQRIREQQQFCASHQQSTAAKDWEMKGYPEINWDAFDERVRRHFQDLEKLLVPDCTSYYRNILDTTLKSGQAKNFRLTLAGDGIETISCGYYGTKGAAKM